MIEERIRNQDFPLGENPRMRGRAPIAARVQGARAKKPRGLLPVSLTPVRPAQWLNQAGATRFPLHRNRDGVPTGQLILTGSNPSADRVNHLPCPPLRLARRIASRP